MSTQTQEPVEMATKPVAEHEWLKKLVGNWRSESDMTMPDGTSCQSKGTETVTLFGGLWAYTEGRGEMPDGNTMEYKTGLGWDVSFKEYRGFWIANVSSHLWKQVGELSADGKVMTLTCEGPHMERDGETALYRDVIEIIDDNNRTMKSFGRDDEGNWHQFMTVRFTRV